MKKTVKIILALVLVAAIACGAFAAFAAGESAVIYNGMTRRIELQNALPFGSSDKPDLFTSLKNIMPGDSVTQDIKVGVKNLGIDTVRLHLRAANYNEDFRILLEEYSEWIHFTVKNGDAELTGDLSTGVMLGEFKQNKTETISVTLTIDETADNQLQPLVAEVDWIFTVEHLPGTVSGDGNLIPVLTGNHVNYLMGYEDGTIRPDASITRAEVATIFYRLLTDESREEMQSNVSKYPDVNTGNWFNTAVCTLTNGGILEGYEDGTFRPNEPISRAELATIICRFDSMFGEVEVTKGFDDVKGHWAEKYVAFSAERGYVEGYDDGLFRPERDITRAETVAMVNRLLHRAVDKQGLCGNYVNWPDNYKGNWYYYDILEASSYHDYTRSDRKVEDKVFCYENWTLIRDAIQWDVLEAQWMR